MSWMIKCVGSAHAVKQKIDAAAQVPYALPAKIAEAIKTQIDAFPKTPHPTVISLETSGHIDPTGGYSNAVVDVRFIEHVTETPPAAPE